MKSHLVTDRLLIDECVRNSDGVWQVAEDLRDIQTLIVLVVAVLTAKSLKI